MIIFKFLVLMLACCAIYMVHKADYLTFAGGLAALLAVACIIVAIII